MAANIKFKTEILEELKKSFEVEETINTFLSGKTKCNSVKKVHLETFRKLIKYLSTELNWKEEDESNEVVEETKTEIENSSADVEEEQPKREICKDQEYGRTGKKPDQQGKICQYSHPQVCKNHENLGKCMNHKCKKLYLNLCRNFMRSMFCNQVNCKFLHPRRLERNSQLSKNFTTGQVYNTDAPTYAQALRKI